MTALREFVGDLLESSGAVVDPVEPDSLDVLAPECVRAIFGWPEELVRLAFGASRPEGAVGVGLEGDWLDRFAALISDRGQMAQRQLPRADATPPGEPERLLERALELPNAVWRFQSVNETWTKCLLLAFRYTATSDEKRDGLVWIGFNLGTGAVLHGPLLQRLRAALNDTAWIAPQTEIAQGIADCRLGAVRLASLTPQLIDHFVHADLEPFLRSMRRRLDRDRARVHAYHDELSQAAQGKIAKFRASASERAAADLKREMLRVDAIKREYAAKMDDLRHKYALAIKVELVQGQTIIAPVQRFEVLVKRRKGERRIFIDWHSALRMLEPLLDEAGLGLDAIRYVCDEHLHLTGRDRRTTTTTGKDRCPVCYPAAQLKCPS